MANRFSRMRSADYTRCRDACGLSDDESAIMDGLRHDRSAVSLCQQLNISRSSYYRRLSSLNDKVDIEL